MREMFPKVLGIARATKQWIKDTLQKFFEDNLRKKISRDKCVQSTII